MRPFRNRELIQFGEKIEIQDLGRHNAATVLNLSLLLAGPVQVVPDPKRKNFYDVDSGATVYYIYVAPVSKKIFLLATWKKRSLWPRWQMNITPSAGLMPRTENA
jgi:hypothetical protein